jgi:hypothetical protein
MIGVVALTTFLVFFIEGLVHYNIGKNKLTKLQFPQGREMLQWVFALAFFSMVNGVLASYAEEVV